MQVLRGRQGTDTLCVKDVVNLSFLCLMCLFAHNHSSNDPPVLSRLHVASKCLSQAWGGKPAGATQGHTMQGITTLNQARRGSSASHEGNWDSD